jgi:uncharacterized integral membrane protein
MNFLKTLFWVVLAVSLAIFANRNWSDVTVNLWGDLQVDIKLPVLMLVILLVGFLPPYFILRGKLWGLKRRLAIAERPPVPPAPAPVRDSDEAAI